jgi:pimeloyl-ACP methyl ester carboxylesterase
MMNRIISKDSTPIAYQQSGKGPPLVLVHGTTADHTRWAPVLQPLEEHFTLYALDRRGRGESGDADAEHYSIEREFDDVAAVVDSIGEPAYLLGHSYGALCSLEAALRTKNLRKLVLYEPPIPTGIELYPSESVERIRAALAAGDRDGAVAIFMREIAQAPQRDLDVLRSAPAWQGRVAAAHTILREIQSSDTYIFEPARFRQMTVPTLLLLGGDSPPFLQRATQAAQAALPNNRIAVMPGQQHVAMNTAPDLFVREVLRFLLVN